MSEPVIVDVTHTQFNPILTAGSHNVSVGQSVELTGTIARSLDGSGYWMRIVQADSGAVLANCTTGTTCTFSDSIGWNENVDPQVRRYKLKVARSNGTGYVWESPTIAVNTMPVRYGIDIAASEATPDTQGNKRWTVTATSDRSVTQAGYWIRIKAANGSSIANCVTGTTCQADYVNNGRYKAYVVKNSTGETFGESFWIDLSNDGAVVLGDRSVDFLDAQDRWSSVEEFCIDVAAYGDHISGASVSDQWLETCTNGDYSTVDLAMLALLRTPDGPRVLATVVILSSSVAIATAFHNAYDTVNGPEPDPSATPTPTATPPSPPPTPVSPVPSTDGTGIRYPDLEQVLIDHNASSLDQQIDDSGQSVSVAEAVHVIARECVARTALAGEDPGLCATTPIFASGADVQEATNWDMTALGGRIIPNVKPHPEWTILHYTPDGAQPGWYRGTPRPRPTATTDSP